MDIKEYLINMLAEESTEVAHAALKANRFGLDDFHPMHPATTNRQLILQELCDVRAVVELLEEAGEKILLSENEMRELIDTRKRKVTKWMKLSERLGTLETNTSWAYSVREGDLVVIEKLSESNQPIARFISTVIDMDSSSFKIDEDIWFYKDTLTAYTGPFRAVGLIKNNT